MILPNKTASITLFGSTSELVKMLKAMKKQTPVRIEKTGKPKNNIIFTILQYFIPMFSCIVNPFLTPL